MPYNPKKGQDQYASDWSQYFLPFESGLFSSGLGNYGEGWRSALDAFSPSQSQARIDAFRNNALQTAARAGQQGALGAKWQGLGSGSQESFMNNAFQNASNQVGSFAADQMSPEMAMRRFAGMQGLFNPMFMNQSQGFSAARKGAHTPPGGGFLGGLLQAGAQAYGGGMFGGMGGGGQAGSGWNPIQQTQTLQNMAGGLTNFGWR